jgi:hypothetical protein
VTFWYLANSGLRTGSAAVDPDPIRVVEAAAEAGAARATKAPTATARVFFLISFEFLSRVC